MTYAWRRGAWLIGALWLAACPELGNGHRKEEDRELANFDRVHNSSDLDVSVVPGDSYSVIVSIDSNLLDRVVTRVQDGELYITTRGGFESHLTGANVRVQMPVLTGLSVSGSGDLTAGPFDDSEKVDVSVSGDADLTWSGTASVLDVKVSGSGDATLHGSAGYLDARTSGSGDLRARDCDVMAAKVQVSGDGDAAVSVSGDIDATVSGSGDLDVYGSPHFASRNVSGDGDINTH